MLRQQLFHVEQCDSYSIHCATKVFECDLYLFLYVAIVAQLWHIITMRLTYNIGRWVGRVWAKAQLRKNPDWFTPRHHVDTKVIIHETGRGIYRLHIYFSACGQHLATVATGEFRRYGMKTEMPGAELVTAGIVCYDGHMVSDFDLDFNRVWRWWAGDCSIPIGRVFSWSPILDPERYHPLYRRHLHAIRLASLYPYSYHHAGITRWLDTWGRKHSSPWPEDWPTYFEQQSLNDSIYDTSH